MRVAIDATPLTVPTGGITRYTAELSRALAEQFPEDEFVLVSDQPFEMPAVVPINLRRGGGPCGAAERRWWLWGLPRELERQGAAIFHGTDFAVPYIPRRPSVLTLHDLSPWMNPAWHDSADRIRRRTPLLIRMGVATVVLTDSEAVRRQAIDFFGISPARIFAVPLAASAAFQPVPAPDVSPYFLYVGTLEPRKGIPDLIGAWRAVRKRHDAELWIAGRHRADFPEIAPEPGLRLCGPIPDEALPALYSGTLAFVYPSHYEGFGLPVLEAMQCGAMVITSKDAAITEVTGGAAVQVDSARGLVEAMTAALGRPEWVGAWRARSLARARQFSWERTARETREVYEEALRRFA